VVEYNASLLIDDQKDSMPQLTKLRLSEELSPKRMTETRYREDYFFDSQPEIE
jgi:hypothetical protein